MAEKGEWSRERFLSMARAAGFDIQDPHMEELYPYVQDLLPGLKSIEELDLTGIEPAVIFVPSKES
jgi:hypothetical protein